MQQKDLMLRTGQWLFIQLTLIERKRGVSETQTASTDTRLTAEPPRSSLPPPPATAFKQPYVPCGLS